MLVEMHQSEIRVHSEEGRGSIFSFKIRYPIAQSMQITSSILLESEIGHSDLLENVRILMAEDNEMNQKLASKYLTRHGAFLEIVPNGQEAVDRVRDSEFDAILMDLQMPVMDGYQATGMIRNELKNPIPIVACTAHSLVGEKKKCLDIGMNGYVSKPYTEKELVDSIFQVLPESSRRQKERLSGIRSEVRKKIEALKKQEGPDFLESLLQLYNQRIPGDLTVLKTALIDKDYELIREKAHLVSSSLAALNFNQGFQVAHDLENAIREKDYDAVYERCSRLIEFLEKSLEVTQQYKFTT
jgi:CheY-like chemotaxis protein/HPt (histidine-containing phosphotransfer) domain-containing protein